MLMAISSLPSRAAWLLLLALLLAGCGRNAGGLTPVTGKLNYRGRPLTTGTIVFAPDPVRGSNGELARAEVQADGSYHLKSGENLGTNPGFYRVTVVAVEDVPVPGTPVLVMPRSLLPAKYQDPDLSGLTCEVKPGKENIFNFNLE